MKPALVISAMLFSQASVVLWNMAVALLIVKKKVNMEILVWGWLMCSVTWALGFYHNVALNYGFVKFQHWCFILLSIADIICVLGVLSALGAAPLKEKEEDFEGE